MHLSKEQIEKFNNLLGALICHGKDSLDYDYVEDDLVSYFIEEFLYSLDNEFRDYLKVQRLYKKESKNEKGPTLYIKTENDYKSDVEVVIDNRSEKDICRACICSNCQACYDRYCPGEIVRGKEEINCEKCKYSSNSSKKYGVSEIKNNFKRKCDGKFEAVKSWCIECSSYDMITPLVDEWRAVRKKINFRRALKSWRNVYRYIDSFYLEDENDKLEEPIYPFRYWYWIRYIGNAIEYGLWGIIDYFNISKIQEKKWYWYKRMQTYLIRRQDGDIMPNLHFNVYVYHIRQFLKNNKVENKETLLNIIDRISEESDIISHWGQNGAYSLVAPGNSNDLSTMPCSASYYKKIKSLCSDFMNYIKELMKLKNEKDIMSFIGIRDNTKYAGIQIESESERW